MDQIAGDEVRDEDVPHRLVDLHVTGKAAGRGMLGEKLQRPGLGIECVCVELATLRTVDFLDGVKPPVVGRHRKIAGVARPLDHLDRGELARRIVQ